MNFTIELPAKRYAESAWALSVLLGENLESAFVYQKTSTKFPVIFLGKKRLELSNAFFDRADSCWLQPASLPDLPLPEWEFTMAGIVAALTSPTIPVLFGQGRFERGRHFGSLGLDVVGSAFFMLARYEELVIPQRDEFDRFPTRLGIAARAGFAGRPLIDEYREILVAAIQAVWPESTRLVKRPKTCLSCDVDAPLQDAVFSRRKFWSMRIKSNLATGEQYSDRKSILANCMETRAGNWNRDPFNTFGRMMDLAEGENHRIDFYFLAGTHQNWKHGWYKLDHPFIRELLRSVSSRGHRIGLHGSFGTFRNSDKLKRQRADLANTCAALGIGQNIKDNRQHYLQFDARISPQALEKAGLASDSSGGFADRPGFRFGTCRSFRMWNWVESRPSNVLQHPLILMECSVLDAKYMGRDHSQETYNLMLDYKRNCFTVGGSFNLLWHNSNLLTEADWHALKYLLTRQ